MEALRSGKLVSSASTYLRPSRLVEKSSDTLYPSVKLFKEVQLSWKKVAKSSQNLLRLRTKSPRYSESLISLVLVRCLASIREDSI